jgi:hypothetical protein
MILRELTGQLQLGTAGTASGGGTNFTGKLPALRSTQCSTFALDTFASVLSKTNLGTFLPQTIFASFRSGADAVGGLTEGDAKQACLHVSCQVIF